MGLLSNIDNFLYIKQASVCNFIPTLAKFVLQCYASSCIKIWSMSLRKTWPICWSLRFFFNSWMTSVYFLSWDSDSRHYFCLWNLGHTTVHPYFWTLQDCCIILVWSAFGSVSIISVIFVLRCVVLDLYQSLYYIVILSFIKTPAFK